MFYWLGLVLRIYKTRMIENIYKTKPELRRKMGSPGSDGWMM
jgi:hypothetical protein